MLPRKLPVYSLTNFTLEEGCKTPLCPVGHTGIDTSGERLMHYAPCWTIFSYKSAVWLLRHGA